MRATLVRVAIDQAYGKWNGPVDPETNEFVYVPIPDDGAFRPGMTTRYADVVPALDAFASGRTCTKSMSLPGDLEQENTHLDPDFRNLTYGDKAVRGKQIAKFDEGDMIVFYSGLRPCRPCEHRLVYAIVGLFRVEDVTRLTDVPEERWGDNAHTRRVEGRKDDVIVRAIREQSGRLRRCIPIGEWRENAYRVRKDLLQAWGGLSCNDGYIQRSAVLPMFSDAARFARWFERQHAELVAHNNPPTPAERQADLASHARVAALLARVPDPRRAR